MDSTATKRQKISIYPTSSTTRHIKVQQKNHKIINISQKDILITELIKGCLNERDLTPTQLDYVVSLAEKISWNQDQPPSPTTIKIDNWVMRLAFVLTHMSKRTTTGKFSLSYNFDLDACIKKSNGARIRTLWVSTGPEHVYPELYENPKLSDIEKAKIKEIYINEYTAMLNTIINLEKNNELQDLGWVGSEPRGVRTHGQDEIHRISTTSRIKDYKQLGAVGTSSRDFVSQAYQKFLVCYEKCYKEISPSKYNNIDAGNSNSVILVPMGRLCKSGTLTVSENCYYDFMDLMFLLANEKQIGTERNTTSLKKRYGKEISMVLLHLNRINHLK